MAPPQNSADLVQQFCDLTQASPEDALRTLEDSEWEYETAVQTWFAIQHAENDSAGDAFEMEDDDEPDVPQPIPSASTAPQGTTAAGASSKKSKKATGGIRTLSDLDGSHDNGDDDENSDNDYFAGGEKSGLAVHGAPPPNPRDQIEGLLNRARQNAPRPGGDDDETSQPRFTGRGVTLGGDDAPSRVIEDPTAVTTRPRAERVARTLHLWQDGFSVDDGDLYRYDDPANQETLNLIHSGRAPLHLLNVQPGQEVDLSLDVQKDKAFVKPKAKYKPFGGSGQRLGSPTPGPSFSSAPAVPAPQPAAVSKPAEPAQMSVDSSQPIITLQIRLGDGTRLQSRFNTTHTIGDVYGFVDNANATNGRAYALMTTFPSKELDDRSVVLGDLAEFKRGGVIVQKWK